MPNPEHPRYDPDRYAQLLDQADDAEALQLLQLRELLAWANPDPSLVSLLPKGRGKGDKGHCPTCGGYHESGMFHLDYVGHADATKVLASIDPWWSWEPTGTDEHGRPVFDTDDRGRPMGLWIRLTVAGVTRLGYGTADAGKSEVEKELIGDAIRNAAMRFGVAVDLWSKADQSGDSTGGRTSSPSRQAPKQQAPATPQYDWDELVKDLDDDERQARQTLATKWRQAKDAAPSQVWNAAPLTVGNSLAGTFGTLDLDELQQLVEDATEAAAAAVAGEDQEGPADA